MFVHDGASVGSSGGERRLGATRSAMDAKERQRRAMELHLESRRRGNRKVVAGVSLFGLVMFSFPYWYSQWKPQRDMNAPLRPHEVRRGPFNNSGSKDIGADPAFLQREGRSPDR
ncbi:hypothetical protein FVE85_1704 [Porphyridium purpureum]|uniref:Transmembrane protein n=1 Tax=Porphyridium purpureum TaxID=35688 RepID=A0A5J4YVL8_PORPP|nr:hypothetical protein FVE85_1704 [Porphyridium purpureum]|eukprot:POR6443..scf209_3